MTPLACVNFCRVKFCLWEGGLGRSVLRCCSGKFVQRFPTHKIPFLSQWKIETIFSSAPLPASSVPAENQNWRNSLGNITIKRHSRALLEYFYSFIVEILKIFIILYSLLLLSETPCHSGQEFIQIFMFSACSLIFRRIFTKFSQKSSLAEEQDERFFRVATFNKGQRNLMFCLSLKQFNFFKFQPAEGKKSEALF